MKKFTFCIMSTALLLTIQPLQASAITNSLAPPSINSQAVEVAEAKVLLTRLYEISEMDKSDLMFSEKKTLRREVRSIKQKLTMSGGGVYISVGAVLLIVLILIILL